MKFLLGRGNFQRFGEIEEQQRPAVAFVLAGECVEETLVGELRERLGRQRLVLELVGFVPPGDDRRDVQVLGLHQQGDIGERAMDMEVAGPPALLFHVDEAVDLDRLGVVGVPLDREVARAEFVFRAAFQFKCVTARSELERHFAGYDEMVVPGDRARHFDRPAGLVLQMHAGGGQLAAICIDDADFKPAGARCQELPGGQ
jgi:hypothetical protein